MSGALLQELVGGGLTVIGGVFMVVGALGLIRMPDVFTRLHAASVIDTAGAGLILLGLIVIAGFSPVSIKLVILVLMFGLLGPVASHAVARAALHAGIRPQVVEDEAATSPLPLDPAVAAAPVETEDASSKP